METLMTVGQLLQAKGRAIWAVKPDDSVYDALTLMAARNIGAVLVMEGDLLVGIMSERDYARKVILQGKTSRETLVREIMTPKVVCVRTDASLAECMALMTDKRVRHLPVIEGNRVVGVVSIGDVVKRVIAEQEFVITQLEHYITGTR
jgi:CBS domain-containing protein